MDVLKIHTHTTLGIFLKTVKYLSYLLLQQVLQDRIEECDLSHMGQRKMHHQEKFLSSLPPDMSEDCFHQDVRSVHNQVYRFRGFKMD